MTHISSEHALKKTHLKITDMTCSEAILNLVNLRSITHSNYSVNGEKDENGKVIEGTSLKE